MDIYDIPKLFSSYALCTKIIEMDWWTTENTCTWNHVAETLQISKTL